MTNPTLHSSLLSTPIPSPRPLSLHLSTPFANPFDTLHLDPHTPSSLFDPSPGVSDTSVASIKVARVAERRGVNLAQLLDLAEVGFTVEEVKDFRLGLAPSLLLSSPDDQSPPVFAILGERSLPSMPTTPSSTTSDVEPTLPSAPLPAVDESFMRWSRTASVISSQPSTFYYNSQRSTSYQSEMSPPATAPPAPGAETYYPPSSFQNPVSHPPAVSPQRPDPRRRESANSAGTFGNRQRRWSALHSTTSVAADDFSPGDSPADTPLDEEIQFGSTSSRTHHRRPLSMSSASDSAFSVQPNGLDRIRVGRSNISATNFPSPTLRRPTHKTPESTAEITAHLLKASGKNESRIVPRLTPIKQAPTVGTPISARVREEGVGDEQGRERRRASKLDQLLGEGAETARVLMEFDRRDRRAVQDVVQLPGMTRLPPPPRHRPSTAPTPSSIPILPPSTPPSASRLGHIDDRLSPHARNNSVDSLPSSLHPSIAESTNTVAHLIPASPQTAVRRPTDKELAKLYSLPKPEVHNDLTPEQRAILVRRTRKIERMLGEPLSELKVGQHVVRPSTASAVIHTSRGDAWPPSPMAGERRVPEYDRQDCVPRTVRADKTPGPAKKGTSKIALKAMAALGLGEKKEDDLRVYVSREQTVSEVVHRVRTPLPQPPASPRRSGQSDEVGSPVEEGEWDEGEVARKARRSQVAKLQRLLGEPVPASAFQPHNLDSSPAHPAPSAPRRPLTPQRSSSANGISFISFDDDTPSSSWTKRMRSAINATSKDKDKDRERGSSFWDGTLNRDREKDKGKKTSLSAPPQHDSFSARREVQDSFMDLKEEFEPLPQVEDSYGARLASMKSSRKLEKVLGSMPPISDFPPYPYYEPDTRRRTYIPTPRSQPDASTPTQSQSDPTHLSRLGTDEADAGGVAVPPLRSGRASVQMEGFFQRRPMYV